MTPFESLLMAIDRAGGQSALGRICKRSQPTVWKWLQSSKRLPAEHVLKVEAATGVSRHWLRPDIYPHEIPSDPRSAPEEPDVVCGPILSARTMGRHGNQPPILDEKGAAA